MLKVVKIKNILQLIGSIPLHGLGPNWLLVACGEQVFNLYLVLGIRFTIDTCYLIYNRCAHTHIAFSNLRVVHFQQGHSCVFLAHLIDVLVCVCYAGTDAYLHLSRLGDSQEPLP